MQAVTKFRGLLLLASVLELLPAAPVYADCSNPPGVERNQIYNNDSHTYQFCDGTKWVSMSGIGTSGPFTFISTQTASSSESLQFTNLPSTYNTLFLNCNGIITSVNTVIPELQVGEGSPTTWKTENHYTATGQFSSARAGGSCPSTTTSQNLFYCNGLLPADPTAPFSLKAYIDNVGSSSTYKQIIANTYFYWSTIPGEANFNYTGYWNADTNPITGIQLVAAGGTFKSGQCSLYGMN